MSNASVGDGLSWDSDGSKKMSDPSLDDDNVSEIASRAWDSESS